MKSEAQNPDEYIEQLPDERKRVIKKLRETILRHLPKGIEETLSYGMIGYVVPHSVYPKGYHVNPELPLPFINVASQKNHIALYHSGIYANRELLNWFTSKYKKRLGKKPDMGKSCIRFKNLDEIPYELIGELAGKMSVDRWIEIYEEQIKR
jgi:uncharacterized protein YdhG (YjbR/CyaY superfamily)